MYYHSMKKNRIWNGIIDLVILLSLWGCTTPYERALAKCIEDNLSSSGLKNYEMIIIMPSIGCGGCISAAEDYFKNNADDVNLLFIFTHIVSPKNLRIRLGGTRVLMKNNVILDNDDLYYLSDFEERIYPYSVKLKDGHVYRIMRFQI